MAEAIGVVLGLAGLGLVWRIGTKVGRIEGKVDFVCDKIKEHNKLTERIVLLEVLNKVQRSKGKD